MDCSIIIVSYNTFELTVNSISTAATSASPLEYEILVVDNASPDESGARLKREFADRGSRVKIIQNDENLGFAAANNIGARMASGRILFFLNPDTIVHNDAVVVLATFLDAHPEAGAVGPLVLNRDGTVQQSSFPRLSASSVINHHLPALSILARKDTEVRETGEVEIVYGAALALRRDVFDQIGGWDEAYFMYCEETELCYALLQAGYSNYFVREAAITHFGGASSLDRYSEQMILHNRTLLTFMKRHHSAGLRTLHRFTGLLGFTIRVLVFKIMELIRPDMRDAYRRRRDAAWEIAKWFALDFTGFDE